MNEATISKMTYDEIDRSWHLFDYDQRGFAIARLLEICATNGD